VIFFSLTWRAASSWNEFIFFGRHHLTMWMHVRSSYRLPTVDRYIIMDDEDYVFASIDHHGCCLCFGRSQFFGR
jgi:hypothetical protein